MPVIAVYSVKGGVGKTTIAVDLAWRCAQIGGHQTLLWDLDRRVARASCSVPHRAGRRGP